MVRQWNKEEEESWKTTSRLLSKRKLCFVFAAAVVFVVLVVVVVVQRGWFIPAINNNNKKKSVFLPRVSHDNSPKLSIRRPLLFERVKELSEHVCTWTGSWVVVNGGDWMWSRSFALPACWYTETFPAVDRTGRRRSSRRCCHYSQSGGHTLACTAPSPHRSCTWRRAEVASELRHRKKPANPYDWPSTRSARHMPKTSKSCDL